MSKLTRRKITAQEFQTELHFPIKQQQQNLRNPDAALQSRNEGSPAGVGVSSCRSSTALCEVEKLWMKTLQVLCPQLWCQDSEDFGVPALPHFSTDEKEVQSGHCWCNMDEDVIPFPTPDPIPGSAPFPSSPDTRHRDDCIPIHITASSLSQGNQYTDPPQYEWDGNGIRRRSGSGSEHHGTQCGHQAEVRSEGSSGTKPRVTSGSGITSGSSAGHRDGISGSGSGSDGIRLECCPMCLMSFPVGFSQMECDAHLAQCLSEMNVDVLW